MKMLIEAEWFIWVILYIFDKGKTEIISNITEKNPACIKLFKNAQHLTPSSEGVMECSSIKSLTSLYRDLPNDVRKLIIQNSTAWDLDPKPLIKKNFNLLEEVSFIDSYVGKEEIAWLQSLKSLTTLHFRRCWNGNATLPNKRPTGNNIKVFDIDLSALEGLKEITILECYILNLKISREESIPRLFLDNNHFDCCKDFVWILDAYNKEMPGYGRNERMSLNNTFCFVRKGLNDTQFPMYYTFDQKPFVPVMGYQREAVVNCPPKCTCRLMGMHKLKPQLNVDCIGVNMTKLPNVIPKGTSRCNFSYNEIEDISSLFHSKVYDTVSMLVLSHNEISYLDPIKFPNWLRQYRDVGINLDHNKLTSIPAHAIKQAFDDFRREKRFIPQFLLGQNPYICTCDYIKEFQELVYHHLLSQYGWGDIRCSINDTNNPGVAINLAVTSMCERKPIFRTLDYINLSLAILLLFIVLSYAVNYYRYRKYQKLPWIITMIKW